MTRPLYLQPAEAVVLRHALMSYRNNIAERNRDHAPYPMSDGFELAAADVLVQRLDIMSEAILTDDQRAANEPVVMSATNDGVTVNVEPVE